MEKCLLFFGLGCPPEALSCSLRLFSVKYMSVEFNTIFLYLRGPLSFMEARGKTLLLVVPSSMALRILSKFPMQSSIEGINSATLAQYDNQARWWSQR